MMILAPFTRNDQRMFFFALILRMSPVKKYWKLLLSEDVTDDKAIFWSLANLKSVTYTKLTLKIKNIFSWNPKLIRIFKRGLVQILII